MSSGYLTDIIHRAPKVILHDHLDGGLRPGTIIELAEEIGHVLPANNGTDLAEWFIHSASSGSLEEYLETFGHTVAVMQTRESLVRVARECVLDLASDNVIYAEIRYAPECHLEAGLHPDEVVEAVQEGIEQGVAAAREQGHCIRISTLLTALRHTVRSREVAELAVRHRDNGVVGFDIAGAEAGYPPSRHLDAFDYLHRENYSVTIHAGEAFGLPSIWEAVQVCGTNRLGHGVRIIDDIIRLEERDEQGQQRCVLGRLASWIRDNRIPLELCPKSNVQTGAANSISEHPITLLKDLGFRVTVNTDNRLVSGTTMTEEMISLVDLAGWTMYDLRRVTINALKSAFIPYDERSRLIERVVKPEYDSLIAEWSAVGKR